MQLEIPPGALTAEDVDRDHSPDGRKPGADPRRQAFKLPVHLHLVAPAGSSPNACAIQWYNPGRGMWVVIPSSPESAGRMAPLAHFSSYRILELVN